MAGLFQQLSRALFGTPERTQTFSTLNKDQQQALSQLLGAIRGEDNESAFGQASSYYRDLLDPSGQAQEAFAAPEMRKFQEEIMPQLAERFAGMGTGAGLSSSMFRNAATREASSLAERLAAMRAGLQQQGAQGLQQLGQTGLGQFQETQIRQRTPGLLGGIAEGAAPALGTGLSALVGQSDLFKRMLG